MSANNKGLLKRSYVALVAGARQASGFATYDAKGYAPDFRQNLMSGLPLQEIVADLDSGAGRELDGKLRAAHSSAALAVNSFGPWRINPEGLHIAGIDGFQSMRFEATCSTGLGGTPPHLDVLADGDALVAVESKCTEWMTAKPASFSSSYDRLDRSHGHSPWFKQVEKLRSVPGLYSQLDAAQLVKHALGLLTVYGPRKVKLMYFYWEPRNAHEFPECRVHRAEAEDLAHQVAGCTVELHALSYRQLWDEWQRGTAPSHLMYLRRRYDCEV